MLTMSGISGNGPKAKWRWSLMPTTTWKYCFLTGMGSLMLLPVYQELHQQQVLGQTHASLDRVFWWPVGVPVDLADRL
jgi:hypothetical protein